MADKTGGMFAALDIGSSKVTCAVALPRDNSSFQITALASSPCTAVKDGSIVDINQALEVVRHVVGEAERLSQMHITTVSTGISGTHIRSDNVQVMTPTRRNEVTQSDIELLRKMGESAALAPSMCYLDVIPQYYMVDGSSGIQKPVGLASSRVDASLHMITAHMTPCSNLGKVLKRGGLELLGGKLEFSAVAASEALLLPQEKNLGVLLIDIGADLTDYTLYYDDALIASGVEEGAGNSLTDEVSKSTQFSRPNAERLKVKKGMVCFEDGRDPNFTIELPQFAGQEGQPRTMTAHALSALLQKRLEKILNTVYYHLREKDFHRRLSFVVLTGGTAAMPGIEKLARQIFSQHMAGRDVNVRVASPVIASEGDIFYAPDKHEELHGIRLASYTDPSHSAVMGYLMAQMLRSHEQGAGTGSKRSLRGLLSGIRSWFEGNF